MKYIKFVKDHTSGNFREGDHVKCEQVVFEGWTASEFAEPSTKKEYEAHIKEVAEKLKADTLEARKAHQAKIEEISGKNKKSEKVSTVHPSGNDDGSGNDKGTGSENGNDSSNGADSPSAKLYHELTQEDLDANEIYCKGLEVGTEVEIDEAGLFTLNDEEQMIVKPTE